MEVAGPQGEIHSGGDLYISAGLDLKNVGASLAAEGNAQLVAGRDVSFDALALHYNNRWQNGSDWSRQEGTTQLASNVDIGGNLALQTQNKLTLAATNLNIGGDATLLATGDLSIESRQEIAITESHKEKKTKKSWGRRQHEVWHDTTAELTAVGTSLATGGSLTLQSQNDIRILGSDLYATDDLTLALDGDLAIQSAREEHHETHDYKKRKSWLGIRYGLTNEHESISMETLRGSEVGAGKDSTMHAGGNLTLTSSKAWANQNLTLTAAGNIDLLADQETYTRDYELEEKGFYRERETNESGATASEGYREEKTVEHREGSYSVSSQAAAGANLTIQSGADITTQGAFLNALEGDIALAAAGDILLLAALHEELDTYEHDMWQIGVTAQATSGILAAIEALRSGADLISRGGGEAGTKGMVAGLMRAHSGMGTLMDFGTSLAKTTSLTDLTELSLINVSVTVGVQASHEEEKNQHLWHSSTELNSGGSITMDSGSDITLEATQATAEGDITANAEGDININQSLERYWGESESWSGGASIGVGYSVGAGGGGFGLVASASFNTADGSYDSGTWSDTALNAGPDGHLTLNAAGSVNRQQNADWDEADSSSFGLSFSHDGSRKGDDGRTGKESLLEKMFGDSAIGKAISGFKKNLYGEGGDDTGWLGQLIKNADFYDVVQAGIENAWESSLEHMMSASEHELANTNLGTLAATSGLSAMASNAVGHLDILDAEKGGLWDNPFLEAVLRPQLHGLLQGGVAEATGRDFSAGYYSGVAGSYGGLIGKSIAQKFGADLAASKMLQREIAGVLGEVGSQLGGGDQAFGRLIGQSVWEWNDRLSIEQVYRKESRKIEVTVSRDGGVGSEVYWEFDNPGWFGGVDEKMTVGTVGEGDTLIVSEEFIGILGYDPGPIKLDALGRFAKQFNGVFGFMNEGSGEQKKRAIALSIHAVAGGLTIREPTKEWLDRQLKNAVVDLPMAGKAVLNATGKTAGSFVSLGFWEPGAILEITDMDIARGYVKVEGGARIILETGSGLATGGAASVAKGVGTGARLVRAVAVMDAAGNVVMTGRAARDIAENGTNAENTLRLLAGLAGSAGSTKGFLRNSNSVAPGRTVWDDIVPTQPNYQGSVIPRSFELTTPSGQRIWVHGNVTEHMAEFVQMKAVNNLPESVRLASQQQLSSLQSAVETASKNGIKFDEMLNVGGWELKFSAPRGGGQLPALIHALPK